MSDSAGQTYPVTSAWASISAQYTAMANVNAWVQNCGPGVVKISFSSSSSLPTGGGVDLNPGDVWCGNAAYCYGCSLGGTANVAVGLV